MIHGTDSSKIKACFNPTYRVYHGKSSKITTSKIGGSEEWKDAGE